MQLQWRNHLTLSAIHAAWGLVHRPELAMATSPELEAAADCLRSAPEQLGISPIRLWDQLLTLAPSEEGISAFASRIIKNCGCSDRASPILEAAVRQCKSAFQRAHPRYLEEIQVRQLPLQQVWEASGPGLLVAIGRHTEPGLLVESATVFLVPPILNGAGYAHLRANCVHIEAVLTNPLPQLPETLRLAWLLAQLDFERPLYSEMVNAHQLPALAGLAMLPPTLAAAEELELASATLQSTLDALQYWHITEQPAQAQLVAEVLSLWWETYQASRPEWRIALTGLQRMLAEHLPA